MSLRSSIPDRQNRQPAILSRKRKAEKELVASPSSEFSSPPSCSTITSSSCETTPTTDTDMSSDESSFNHRLSATSLKGFRTLAKLLHPFTNACRRSSPLPELDWAEQKELWHSMVLKDMVYTRNPKFLKHHPDLEPHMRSILCDWLSEVCEVYALHRETFHLAIDYVDRFLMLKPNLPRNYLQLLGATALFVASKMEEIYPPKLEQFAYVTAGACSESDILAQEIVLIMTLDWNLSPITANCWLNIFMQLAFLEDGENLIGREKFPRNMYLQISQVLDICILDSESLKFPYSVLTASAMAHFISKETAMHVSGLNWNDLLPCVAWMKPYVEIAFENPVPDVKLFHDVPADDAHNIQTHAAGLKLLDAVQQKKRLMKIERSPSVVLREMTPPQSSKKPHIMDIDG